MQDRAYNRAGVCSHDARWAGVARPAARSCDRLVIIGARLRTTTKKSDDLEECFGVIARLITSDTGAVGEAWHPTDLKNVCVDFDQGQAKALSKVFGNADRKGCYVRDRVLGQGLHGRACNVVNGPGRACIVCALRTMQSNLCSFT